MGNNKIIGAKIKNIRESKQLSIEEVAERSRVRYRTDRTYRGVTWIFHLWPLLSK